MRRAILLITCLLLPIAAQAEGALFTVKMLTVDTALKAAQGALAKCRAEGYQVAVAVVDRSGILQVTLRDRYAGPHTPETARQKAWTAVSFRTSTTELAASTQAGQPQSAMRGVTGALPLGGGLIIETAGSMVGAIGVSGAPGGELDDLCAEAGIEAIADDLF